MLSIASRSIAEAGSDLSPAELAEAHTRLGRALAELGREEAALEALRDAAAADPESSGVQRDLGALLAAMGRPEEGLEHLARALAVDPDSAPTHYQSAEALRMVGRWNEALGHYKRAVDLGLEDENALTGEAEALVAIGRLDDAKVKLDAGLSRFPQSRGMRFGLAWLSAASPDLRLRDGERALALAQELFTARRSLGAAELIAAARAEVGRCDEAARLQQFVIDQAKSFELPSAEAVRHERALEWFQDEPCRLPGGQSTMERPLWPRAAASVTG